MRDNETGLVRDMVRLAAQHGRYGCRRNTESPRREDWNMDHKWIERLWRMESVKVPQKQAGRRRLWLRVGSCIRLRPVNRDYVRRYVVV